MKNLIYTSSALLILLFAASCHRENLEPVQEGSTVTFNVTLPDVATKVTDDGSNVNNLVYAVYRTEVETENSAYTSLEPANFVYQKSLKRSDTESWDVDLELVKNQNYVVLFWAQVDNAWIADDYSFGTEGISYPLGIEANAEKYDAFSGRAYLMNVEGPDERDLELKRAVAQINVGTTLPNAEKYAVVLDKSSVIVKNAGNKFSVAEQEAKETADVTFAAAAVPSGDVTVNTNKYTYAAMNYVFAGSSNVKVTYDIATKSHGDKITNTIENVPVKANYRTNIVGNLLTSDVDYSVTLDKEWGEPAKQVKVVTASDAQDIQDAINGAQEGESVQIDLGGNIDLGADGPIQLSTFAATKAGEQSCTIYVPAGKVVILNLNGKTISQTKNQTAGWSMILNDGNLTIVDTEGNGKISYTDSGNGGEYISDAIYNRGVLVINGGTIENKSSSTVASNGYPHAVDTYSGSRNTSVTINGGTIHCAEYSAIRMFCVSAVYTADLVINGGEIKGAVDMQNGTKVAAIGTLTVNDGTFTTTKNANNIRFANWNSGATEYGLTAEIKGGSFNGGITTQYVPEAANWNKGIITGGTFAFDPSNYVANGYAAKHTEAEKWTIVQAPVAVEGGYEISNAAQLRYFAESVNSGTTYKGETIKLTADIDLNNEEWTPIGSATQDHGFMGDFDGNGKTIKNLKMTELTQDSDGYVYAGLFGITEGTETQENYVKNLVIENVTIETDGLIAAAAIAYPYYTTIENITVKGNINIKGGDYTAGVLAYTRRCVNAKILVVAGNENSVIEGKTTVGGVISDIQMNGGLKANYSDFSASGLTIEGTKCVGGISGIISEQALDGAAVENVSIVCEDNRTGIVAGAIGGKYTLTNVSYENVSGATRVVGATYDGGYYFGQILEVGDVKAIIYTIDNGVKAVSVDEITLTGKNWQNAMDWAQNHGTGWSLASMEDLNEIYDVRFELNDALEEDDKENALFWEGDELYIKNGSIYYALYMSSTEVPDGGSDSNGNAYFPNRVFFKMFNDKGYSDVLYSAFDCINKSAPLRDNYFARAVYTLK